MAQNPLTAQLLRETHPRSHSRWLNQQENVQDQLDASFKEWVDDVACNEKLFKEHVYDNPNLTEFDIRQHRARLYALLSDGETLAIAFTKWLEQEKSKEVKNYLDEIDKMLKGLLQTLFAWHGDFHSQQDIPDSLKQAIKEAESSNLVDFEEPK
jgi:uncharacterized Zn finger protein